MGITLYQLDASPPVRAVYMLLHKLNITDVDYVEINILNKEQFGEEYLKINPQHTVPTLVDDDFIIWDSHAICAYLVNKYREGDTLYPSDAHQRAVVDQRLHFDTGTLFVTLRSTVNTLLEGEFKTIPLDLITKVLQCYDITEKLLTSDWIAGDHLTIADICCVATISSLDALVAIDGNLFPNLKAWLRRCSELDFYKDCNEPGLAIFKQIIKN